MRTNPLAFVLPLAFCVLLAGQAPGQNANQAGDLHKQPTLYTVGYAHLDTQWRWEYPQVIREYLPNTMRDNFALFEKYPHYIFNFSGANRYRMMKEYHPADYAKLKQYVAAGRWFPAGSSMEEGDVNTPSAESIIRQVLYGNEFFRREFGKASAEYMLPDCFGFPASLPSILAHAGVKGFSTQKLTWHSATRVGGPGSPEETPLGIPFNVGRWEGPDGKWVIAALNATDYVSQIDEDLSKSPKWMRRIEVDGKASGLLADYRYYGTGDIGGAPSEVSVRLLEQIVTKGMAVLPPPQGKDEDFNDYVKRASQARGPVTRVGEGPIRVVSSTADQMFLDIKTADAARLPHYAGDLELIEHSAGSLTSQAYHKRWNRKNELLADAAEKASVAAAWLGGRPYPQERLTNAWTLVMGGQFHDIMAGTATPKSYEYSWNDDVLAMNQFADVLTSATQAIALALNTQAQGTPVVVYNPLSIAREDVVEATITNKGIGGAVRVFGPDGKEVPAQSQASTDGLTKLLFLAKVPAVGYAVYDVRPGQGPGSPTSLKVSENSLENRRYRIRLDQNGDPASVFDKVLNKELLAAPARLAFQQEKPEHWPAWNMDWADQQKAPRAYLKGPPKIRVIERGAVRVAVEVTREGEGSKIVQTIRLADGDAGNRVEFANAIDWKTPQTALKAAFFLTASNPMATYNWEIGTIQRGNNEPQKYEVPSHQWIDLTDKSGGYGVTVLSDCKYGSDKPGDNALRLTLIYTPGISEHGRRYGDQGTQDWGHHEIVYGIASHAGDWRREQTDWQALRLNQPLIAFQSGKHPGALGKTFSLLRVSSPRVRVMAVKKAERTDEIVVRLVELDGKSQPSVRISFAGPVIAAREVNGQEMPVAKAAPANGALVTSFGPYQPRTFAVKLAPAHSPVTGPQSVAVKLNYDVAVASAEGAKSRGGFDAAGRSLPAEMLPTAIAYNGVQFQLASSPATGPSAIAARGQTIQLPPGRFNRVFVLAAAADGDQQGTFRIGKKTVEQDIQAWTGYIGQWDNRTWRPGTKDPPEYTGLTPGFIKRAPVAWFASHHHNPDGSNEPYAYSYLFAYVMDAPADARTLTLPNNDKIRIVAISVAQDGGDAHPAQPLYDTLERRPAQQ